MTNYKYRNATNFLEFPQDYEHTHRPSLTLPDQAMTIPQILEKHSRNIPLDVSLREPQYYGDYEFPNPKTLDLVELQQLREEYAAELKAIHDKHKKEQDDKEKQRLAEQEEQKQFFEEWRAHKLSQKSAADNPA